MPRLNEVCFRASENQHGVYFSCQSEIAEVWIDHVPAWGRKLSQILQLVELHRDEPLVLTRDSSGTAGQQPQSHQAGYHAPVHLPQNTNDAPRALTQPLPPSYREAFRCVAQGRALRALE